MVEKLKMVAKRCNKPQADCTGKAVNTVVVAAMAAAFIAAIAPLV